MFYTFDKEFNRESEISRIAIKKRDRRHFGKIELYVHVSLIVKMTGNRFLW